MPQLRVNRETIIVLSSLIIQIPLAIFLGHYYDERVFMATGYLVSSGLNPYQQHDFVGVFSHPLLNGVIPSIGYPPLWPLLLGAIFRLSYSIIPSLLLYNFAIKTPVILGNICLAYAVRHILLKAHNSQKIAKASWLFILFNPFILLTSSAWGNSDTVVAFLCVVSLYFLSTGKTKESAITMAIGVAIKPIAIPLVGIPLLFSAPDQRRRSIQYLLMFSIVLLFSSLVPFFLFGWNIPFDPNEWNLPQFRMAGGMSPFNVIELFQLTPMLPPELEFLGYLWVPALVAGYYIVFRNPPKTMNGLAQKAIGLTLVFFLTRSWLSEPNINLIFPFILLAVGPHKKSFLNFHFTWIIPLLFMFLNFSFQQLFFLHFPSVLSSLVTFDLQFGTLRLIARFLLAIVWQLLSWNVAARMLINNEDK